MAKAIQVDDNKTYIEKNAFDTIIQITNIPAEKRIPSKNDGSQKIDLYKLITLIIAIVTFIHSVLSSCDSSKSWTNLLQLEEKRLEIEEERLEIEKAQNLKKDDIIRYLQSCLELLEHRSESNQEIQGLHEETPEIQDAPKETP